jgi:hypothetical protein
MRNETDTHTDLYARWPDGDYCLLEEFMPGEWHGKSDDYEIVEAPIDDVGEPIFQ